MRMCQTRETLASISRRVQIFRTHQVWAGLCPGVRDSFSPNSAIEAMHGYPPSPAVAAPRAVARSRLARFEEAAPRGPIGGPRGRLGDQTGARGLAEADLPAACQFIAIEPMLHRDWDDERRVKCSTPWWSGQTAPCVWWRTDALAQFSVGLSCRGLLREP